jgi:hypothetical protein
VIEEPNEIHFKGCDDPLPPAPPEPDLEQLLRDSLALLKQRCANGTSQTIGGLHGKA